MLPYLISFLPEQKRLPIRCLTFAPDAISARAIAVRGWQWIRKITCEVYEPVNSLEYE